MALTERQRKKRAQLQREVRLEMRDLIEVNKRRPCADCGQRFPPIVMGFDHNGSEKKGKIADWAREHGTSRKSMNMLREEITKCEVVCANCHRLRHA